MKLVNVATNPVVPTPDHTGATAQEIAGPIAGAKKCIVKLGVFEPGGESIFHIHPRSEQILYVLEGELTFMDGQRNKITARPGQALFVSIGEEHAAFNLGSEKAVYVAVTAPPE